MQFILDHKKKTFYFLPLQSAMARELLGKHGITINLDTIYYFKDDRIYERSSAGLQICRRLKGAYPLLFAFYILPRFLRDPFYNFIAKRRHRLRAGYCMMPRQEDKIYFIQDSPAS